ncbi:methylhydantoinase [Baekduia soli]|uniref:Methylhydantoinase n=1 Tax=Baekduia soli TaxID=496014 RepID=A0A5B8U0D3_9ACTN|nr:hydantoinase B/oxoprolinase family protein [Baekduia soli]QEC46463.1 methylhydantoinase [Baekduia soli]
MRRLGVDVGGTFTDLVLVDEEAGRITVDKVASTPDDPSRAVVEGVRQICAKAGVALADVDSFLHGTTVATNIVLTNTGAEVGMITTEGFRDILHIARHKRPYNFSLQQELPWQSRPLVRRRHRLTVAERITAPDGEVLTPLDDDEVRARVRELRDAGVDAIAVCLLHSYLNPEHERRIKDIVLEEHPGAYLSVSHEVLPLYREFERFSTVCLNAYVGPKVARYVTRFDDALRAEGYRHGVRLMQSSGGLTTVESAAQRPVTMLMSGVVAGLMGGIWVGRMAGHENVVTLDIGGTSADIGVAAGGAVRMRHLLDTKVGDYQAMVPMVDIDTIGAGGGSIAYVDDGGVFRVGPQSAGADPGPACYGRGGSLPTTTDAQLLLGRLRPDRGLLGGDMQLDVELARAAFAELADSLGMTVEEAALGALQVQRFGMTQAIELNSVRRGYDPRDFALVAAGGAGALFACEIARELDIPTVLVPPHPGITSATGLLTTDLQHEFVATERHTLATVDLERLARRFAEVEAQAVEQLGDDGVPEERRLIRRLAECRYAGQGYEVRCEAPAGSIDAAWVQELEERFHAAHETEYGHRFDGPIELINIRALGIGRIDELVWPDIEAGDGDPSAARTLEREVVFDVDGVPAHLPTPFYDRAALRAGDRLQGPAVVEQYDSTTVVPPGFDAEIDRHGTIVITVPALERAAAAEPSTALSTPILMRVIGGALTSIAKEMAGVLFRMSYSSIIRESEDLGAGLFDREGNVLAESDSTPMFMGAMPKIVKNVIALLGDDIHEGDIVVHNDPYGGATHSPDLAIVVPIFSGGELVGFSGASAHLLDIGGAYPGIAIDLVDRWSEGSVFQAVKLSDRGVRQEGMWRHLLANMRTPTQNQGDLEAMIAACELARTRFVDLVGRYGADTVLDAAAAWLQYSERMLRQEIAKLPDGTYETGTGWLDDDGRNRGVKLPVNIKVIVAGDEITFDLTGSSDEVMTGFNCPFEGTTISAMTFIARMVFLDEEAHPVFVPQNEGMLRPVGVIAPEGSIFNPRFPRACFARFCQVQRAVDLALRALADVAPERVTAGNSAHLHFLSYSGFLEAEQEYWVYLEVNEGSYGGRHHRDGLDSVDSLIANTRNNPIEELEWRFPMRTERYELRDDPAAAGRWRGGIGVVRVNRFLVDTVVSCEGERQESDPPWGIFGGHEGHNASLVRNAGQPGEEAWPAKITGYTLKAGDTLEITTPSSGGYGDPLTRDPARVLSDVLDGFTTLELAARDYGVVIDAATMTVDDDATARRRAAAAQDATARA